MSVLAPGTPRYNDSRLRGVDEVVQTKFFRWVPEDTVRDVAFVYKMSSLEEGHLNCAGMHNSRFLRFRVDQTDCTHPLGIPVGGVLTISQPIRESQIVVDSMYFKHNMGRP